MASAVHGTNSPVSTSLICLELKFGEKHEDFNEMVVFSASDISYWDLVSVSKHSVLKIQVDRNRLIEKSSYFSGLFQGSFSESEQGSIIIHWNLESFLSVLRFIYGCPLNMTWNSFMSMHEAALFFGVEALLLTCQVWLDEVTSYRGLESPQLCLDGLIQIWKYGSEYVHDFIVQHCIRYLARNFMWAQSCNSFSDVPYRLLFSCIKHPDLTVDSEKHLCETIILWLSTEILSSEFLSNNKDRCMIRSSLLPLWFITGKRSCHFVSLFADDAIDIIFRLARQPRTCLTKILSEGDTGSHQIRLTKYTQKVDLAGCPQITLGLFLLSVLPFPSGSADSLFRKIVEKSPINYVHYGLDDPLIVQAQDQILTFEAVKELNISKCPSLALESTTNCLFKSFPSLKTLRAAYFLHFKTIKLCHVVQKFPLLTDVDLTLDISPILPAKVSIALFSQILAVQRSTSLNVCNQFPYSLSLSQPSPSNTTKLTLEGRTDFNDSDLGTISDFCGSLNYVNLRGCTSVTDFGLSMMIRKCSRLHSVLACNTSFGINSVQALCSSISRVTQSGEKRSQLLAHSLQTLHIGGCNRVDGMILSELMFETEKLTSLCLREIQLVDSALYSFQGSYLQMLDVSDTKVSGGALSHVIFRNTDLKCLKARGCPCLFQEKIETEDRKLVPSITQEKLFTVIGESCELDEIEFGWGFSFLSLETLKPAIRKLRTIIVGLGGSLSAEGLELLPTICPSLDTVILYFQVVSDDSVMNLIKLLPHLKFLALCYCFGSISSLSLSLPIPNLKNLKLERVTPWMTNDDLTILAKNCMNLTVVSFVGCILLNSGSQDIISNHWPALTSLHLEECGDITSNGIKSLFNCHALEDLMLRHTGPGIPRNFIISAASKLPMLRKISVDICDTSDGDFDIPSFDDRYFLSTVSIAKCKHQKCSLSLRQNLDARSKPVHKETLVLVWNSEKLTRTVVKERL